MATIEAMLMGVPVFGYNAGGTAELVDDQSGFLVDSKDLDTLLERFEKFQTIPYKRNTIKNLTKKKL
jgi:glycosyltransferase involved in cell wall biosynthesis